MFVKKKEITLNRHHSKLDLKNDKPRNFKKYENEDEKSKKNFYEEEKIKAKALKVTSRTIETAINNNNNSNNTNNSSSSNKYFNSPTNNIIKTHLKYDKIISKDTNCNGAKNKNKSNLIDSHLELPKTTKNSKIINSQVKLIKLNTEKIKQILNEKNSSNRRLNKKIESAVSNKENIKIDPRGDHHHHHIHKEINTTMIHNNHNNSIIKTDRDKLNETDLLNSERLKGFDRSHSEKKLIIGFMNKKMQNLVSDKFVPKVDTNLYIYNDFNSVIHSGEQSVNTSLVHSNSVNHSSKLNEARKLKSITKMAYHAKEIKLDLLEDKINDLDTELTRHKSSINIIKINYDKKEKENDNKEKEKEKNEHKSSFFNKDKEKDEERSKSLK